MKRWIAGVLVVALVAITVGVSATMFLVRGRVESGSPPMPGITASAGPDVRVPPRAALTRFYSQTLDWSPCDDFECASLEVPLDYRNPAGRSIQIALLRRPASLPSARLGSLVVNPGGPGAPGTDYARQAGGAFRDALTDRFDVVGFDPRGTGGSSPVDCLSDADLDAYVAGDPDPDSPRETRAYLRQARGFGQGCTALSGDLARHVSTVEAARDLDVLRAALEEDTLTYFGASYGTKLGATYADLFPARVGRLVLDGALDLSLGSRDLSLQQAEGFQVALDAYLQNCVDSTDPCFLGDSVDEGRSRIQALLADIERTPLPAGGRELEIGNAVYGIVTPLYNRDYWYLLTNGLRDALEGDGTVLLQLSDVYTSRELTGDGYSDNSIEANLAINCLDEPESISAGQVAREIPAFEAASPTFGRIFAWSLTGCRGFDPSAATPSRTVDAQGAAPILVIGTTRDPATPMRWAEALASQLESGVLVRRDGDGHTGYNAGNECVDDTVEAYLIAGTVPSDGLSC